ncbi:MAG: PfkB family carbohydrate kinase, partial [Wujia sp.]
MDKIKLVALPCLCADVFDGTEEIRPGGEALNFAVHAAEFDEMDVSLFGIIGDDEYGKTILASIADKSIHTDFVRVEENKITANNRTYLTPEGDRYYKEDSWNGKILDDIILEEDEINLILDADIVFVHFWASCFQQVLELRKR